MYCKSHILHNPLTIVKHTTREFRAQCSILRSATMLVCWSWTTVLIVCSLFHIPSLLLFVFELWVFWNELLSDTKRSACTWGQLLRPSTRVLRKSCIQDLAITILLNNKMKNLTAVTHTKAAPCWPVTQLSSFRVLVVTTYVSPQRLQSLDSILQFPVWRQHMTTVWE